MRDSPSDGLTTASRVARNSLLLLVAQAYIILTRLVLVPLLARYLGREGYGRYSYTYAFVGLFQILALLGLHQILTREIARRRERAARYLGNVLVLKVGLSALAVLMIAAAIQAFPLPRERVLMISIVSAEMLVRTYADVNLSLFRAFQRMEFELLSLFVEQTVALMGVMIVIWLKLGLLAIFSAFLFSAVVRFVFAFAISLVKFERPTLNFDLSLSRRLMRESLPIGISWGLWRIYMRQGTVLLQAMRGDVEVGLFSPALRGYTLAGDAAMAFVSSLFPVFSELSISARDKLGMAYRGSLKFMMVLFLPVGLFAYVFADDIVRLILGEQFGPAASAVRILAPAIVLGLTRFLFSFLLKAIDRQRQETLISALSLIANLGLGFLLIPPWGFIGASVAMVVSEAIFFALGLYLTFKAVPGIGLGATVGKPLLCGLMAAVPTLLLQKAPSWLPLLTGGGVYLLSLWVLGVFSPQEARLIWGLASSLRARLEGLRT